MDYLPETTRLLYSQLLHQCLQGTTPNGRGLSFVKKNIKHTLHWYLQLTIGSHKSQHYLGPDSEHIRHLIEQEKQLWEKAAPDRKTREKLVAMLLSGDALGVSTAEARLFEVLERAGVFLVGAVLIGSHAFGIFGNMLGVNWPSRMTQTHDIDIAGDHHIALGMTSKQVDLKQALLDAEMGFVEIPALDKKHPSTSYRIQGKQLTVDILTPLTGKPASKPVLVPALNSYAEPLRFLDYLLHDTQPAVIVARAGILVNVPSPARYALHKLVTAVRRQAAMHTKTVKDIEQASLLLEVLLEDRPGDIQLAGEAAQHMPKKFMQQLEQGIKQLPGKLSQKIISEIT